MISGMGIYGVGIDTVYIPEFEKLFSKMSSSAKGRMFTEKELSEAEKAPIKREYLAGHFAAKEAVFKALSSTENAEIDLRKIEILNRKNGSPYVNITEALSECMRLKNVDNIYISITHDKDYAMAFAVAESYI